MVCVSIMVQEGAADAAIRQAEAARDGGADLVEFRIDQFVSGTGEEYEERQVLALVAECPLPCIVTCRPTNEGGEYDGEDDARIALFERLGTAFGKDEVPPRFIDVELATYSRSANARMKIHLAVDHPEKIRTTGLILSMHDFDGRPADLSRKLLAMREQTAANVVKVAYRARSLRDNIELFEMLAHRDRPMIALGMGEFGLMSRVLAAKFGAFLTYAGLHSQSTTAPGQPGLRELLDLYRFRSISTRTQVYGVIGNPIGHSLSPLVHNAGFDAIGHDGVYLPLPIAGDGPEGGGYESLKATLGELIDYHPLDFCGASITIPHKENIARLAREMGWGLDAVSAAAGAANTLSIKRRRGEVLEVQVSNTDSRALVESLTEAAGELRGRRVGLLGAGGVARAAAVALVEQGARVVVYNRTKERADDLAAAFAGTGPGEISTADMDEVLSTPCEIYINCTPLGMLGGPDPAGSALLPETLAQLPHETLIMDNVYNPPLTPLLQAAHATGLRTVDGVTMFVRQAAMQFSVWTGQPAPMGLFERIVRERLSG